MTYAPNQGKTRQGNPVIPTRKSNRGGDAQEICEEGLTAFRQSDPPYLHLSHPECGSSK